MQIRPTILRLLTIPSGGELLPPARPRALALALTLSVALTSSCKSSNPETPELPRIPALEDLQSVGNKPVPANDHPVAVDAALETSQPESNKRLNEFLRYCERELLVRAPRGAAQAPAGPASAWFGELVKPKDGMDGAAVAGLATLLFTSFAVEQPDLDGRLSEDLSHTIGLDDEWVVPRYVFLEKRVGEVAFREALRTLVDRHRGGPPIGVAEVAEVFEDVTGEGAFVRAWLSGPESPSIQTQWRYDEARKRVLVRIDQIHGVEGGAPEAFPFRMPLRLLLVDGRLVETSVEVQNRREVLSVDCPSEPSSVTFDPDYWLEGMVEFVDAPSR